MFELKLYVEQYNLIHVYCISFMFQALGRDKKLTKTWPLLPRSYWIGSISTLFTAHIHLCFVI